jgi:hypothetical protein
VNISNADPARQQDLLHTPQPQTHADEDGREPNKHPGKSGTGHKRPNHPPKQGGMGHKREYYLARNLSLAVARSLATKDRTRERCLFDLARRVAAIRPRPGKAQLRLALDEWNRLSAWPADGRWQRQLWGQFLAALDRVEQPTGQRFQELVKVARESLAPACMRNEPDQRLVLLAKVCRALDGNAQGKAWALGVRVAGEALGVSRSHAHRLLGALKKTGIIMQVSPGERGPRAKKAAMWRFIGRQ